jgi:hypothetical protein
MTNITSMPAVARATAACLLIAACAFSCHSRDETIKERAMKAYGIQAGPPIKFVLQNGFHGLIEIRLDSNLGKDLPLTNGEYRVEIPQTGILTVASFKPFQKTHETEASYSNGDKIPLQEFPHAPDVSVFIMSGELTNDKYPRGVLLFFVGSDAEFKEFQQHGGKQRLQ